MVRFDQGTGVPERRLRFSGPSLFGHYDVYVPVDMEYSLSVESQSTQIKIKKQRSLV